MSFRAYAWRDDGPVRDLEGHAVWRVRVATGELTCTGCGETFAREKGCPRCATDEQGRPVEQPPASVETLSYLREGEWERV